MPYSDQLHRPVHGSNTCHHVCGTRQRSFELAARCVSSSNRHTSSELNRNQQFGARSQSASASSARQSRPQSRSTSSRCAPSSMVSGSCRTLHGTRSAAARSRAWASLSSSGSLVWGRRRRSGGLGSSSDVSRKLFASKCALLTACSQLPLACESNRGLLCQDQRS